VAKLATLETIEMFKVQSFYRLCWNDTAFTGTLAECNEYVRSIRQAESDAAYAGAPLRVRARK
jgi:hypothetical protein